MESIRDFLGWEYAQLVAYSLMFPWVITIALFQRNKKSKQEKNQIFKKWWFWLSTIFVGGLIAITVFGQGYWGLGTPGNISKIQLYPDKIVLFDNEVTYYDDERTGTEDYTGHLRIHIIDRETHQKLHEEVIGTNYSAITDSNGVLIISNSNYYRSASDNVIYHVQEFNIDNYKLTKIVDNGGEITVNGKQEDVFDIEATLGIVVTTAKGDQYLYNTSTKEFEPFDGTFNYPQPIEAEGTYAMRAEHYGSDKQILHVNGTPTKLTFLFGEIIETYQYEGKDYVFIKAFTDLTKNEIRYSLANEMGHLYWETDLAALEKEAGTDGFETIDLIVFEKDLMYITIKSYLFEISLDSGKVNWWIKL